MIQLITLLYRSPSFLKRVVPLLSGVFFLLAPFTVEAEETVVEFSLESFSLRNPFKSVLPQKEKKKEEKHIMISKPKEIFRVIEKPKPPVKAEKKASSPPKVIEPKLPNLEAEITGLIWNSDRPQAIVNGEVLEIGDEVNGMKIVNIEKTGVYIKFLEKVLKIKEKEQKKEFPNVQSILPSMFSPNLP